MPTKGPSTIAVFLRELLPQKTLALVIWFILLFAALALRLVGIGWGLPEDHFEYSLYETETETFLFIQQIDLLEGKLNPETPRPFALNLYIGQAVLLAADGLGLCVFHRDIQYYQTHPRELRRCFLTLRGWNLLSALMGIALIFGIGRMAGGDGAGLLAMALAATAPIHITESHFFTHQLRISTYIALTLFLTLLAQKTRRPSLETATAVAAGLTGAVLINGIFTAVALPLLLVFNRPVHKSISSALFSRRGLWLSGLFLASFALAIGGQWPNLPEFIAQFSLLEKEYFYRDPELIGPVQILLFTLPYALGLPLLIAGLTGAGWAVRRRTPARLLIVAFFAVFFIPVILFTVSRARYGLHVLPMTAVLAALAMIEMAGLLSSRVARIVFALVVCGSIGLNLIYSSALLDLLGKRQNTADASDWMEAHVPPDAKIGLVSHFRRGLPGILDEGYFGPGRVYYPNIVSIEDDYQYRLPQDLDYIVVFDLEAFGIYDKYLRFPERFEEKAALARDLRKAPYREAVLFASSPKLFKKILHSTRRPLDLSFNLIPVRIFENMNRFAQGESPVE